MTALDRIANARQGALLGLAVGDALGATAEFTNPSAPKFPMLATGPQTKMVGGGPYGMAPGQVTDDTQMAAALGSSLQAMGGLDAGDVASRYVAWEKVAFDVGTQTLAALSLIASGVSPAQSGRTVWELPGRPPAGNGSLMRTAPIAVFFSDDADRCRDASLRDSAITHFDPRCQLACASFNAAIAACCRGADEVSMLFAAARAELHVAAQHLIADGSLDQAVVTSALTALRADLAAAETDDPDLYGDELHLIGTQGFVRVAFRLAFWELAHAPTFEAALVDVVNRGGDADTNGAITGALVGALRGRTAIPREWAELVLGVLKDETGVFATTYHPRVLLEMLSHDHGSRGRDTA